MSELDEPAVPEEPAPIPIEAREGRWSPFSLGLISNFCDPVLIPTMLTLAGASSELREVAAREAAGHFHEEHPRVRTGAVWGLFFALARFLAVGVLCLAMGLTSWLEPAPAPERPFVRVGTSEYDEIRARLHDRDDATRAIAARHLVEYMESGVANEDPNELLADAFRGGYPPPRNGARHVPSAIVHAVAEGLADVPVDRTLAARLGRLYPSLDPAGRSAVLRILARAMEDEVDGSASRALLALARTETEPHPELRLPVPELAPLPPGMFAQIFALESSPAFGGDVMRAVGLACTNQKAVEGEPVDPAYFVPVLERARRRWAQLRGELALPPAPPGIVGLLAPERRDLAQEAVTVLGVLGCADPHELSSAREALESADPRVVLAGVLRLHAHGQPIRHDFLQRLMLEPLVVEPLFEAYGDDPDLAIPREDVLRSHVVLHIVEHGGFVPLRVSDRAVDPTLGEDVRAYDVGGVAEDKSRVEAVVVLQSWWLGYGATGFEPSEIQIEILVGPHDPERVEAVIERWSFQPGERGPS